MALYQPLLTKRNISDSVLGFGRYMMRFSLRSVSVLYLYFVIYDPLHIILLETPFLHPPESWFFDLRNSSAAVGAKANCFFGLRESSASFSGVNIWENRQRKCWTIGLPLSFSQLCQVWWIWSKIILLGALQQSSLDPRFYRQNWEAPSPTALVCKIDYTFFIGNSIFHLSLELLMKFWKTSLKVA